MSYDYSWLDRPTLERFKLAYKLAVENKQDRFFFDIPGWDKWELVTTFAKYLIEWREGILRQQGK